MAATVAMKDEEKEEVEVEVALVLTLKTDEDNRSDEEDWASPSSSNVLVASSVVPKTELNKEAAVEKRPLMRALVKGTRRSRCHRPKSSSKETNFCV